MGWGDQLKNLFQIALLSKQRKEELPLFLDQSIRVNFADYLTKYNLDKEQPKFWLELQRRILTLHWLLPHPSTWLETVRKESEIKVSIKGSGGTQDFTGKAKGTDDLPLIDINFIVVKAHQDANLITYPSSDWSMVQSITSRFMSRSLRVSLKILGFVVFAAHRWRDLHLARKYKNQRPNCEH